MTNTAATQSPTRKPAHLLVRGDIIRNGGRQYRVLGTMPVLMIPRNRDEASRSATRVTIVPARQGGGRSSKVLFEQDELATMVTRTDGTTYRLGGAR